MTGCLLTGFLIYAGLGLPTDEPTPTYVDLWMYAATNLQVDQNADNLIELMRRAKEAGYTGVVLADYKLNILDRVIDRYFQNAARVKAEAEALSLEIIPCVFPIGYSSGLLAHDPNLAEGVQAAANFVAGSDHLVFHPDPHTQLVNGGFEDSQNDRFEGFGFQDDPGAATVADHETVHAGLTSCRLRDTHTTSTSGNARVIQKVDVRPHGCYRLSAWVKTENLENPAAFRLLATADDGRSLTFFEGGIDSTQDWRQLSVVFNSLDASSVNLYAGLWGGSPGTLWIDDLAIEEISLVNVLRRPGCPLEVVSADGKTRFEEGRDFEPIADPRLGRSPYAGEYEFDHEAPLVRLKPGTRIRDGQRITIRWYHPILIHQNQVACCLSEPEVYRILEQQVRSVRDLFHPKRYFMSHDELRFANWCEACTTRGLTPGRLLADNARRCVEITRKLDPKAGLVVWSDMFDPHHNAVDAYYLVNGSLKESWDGLPPEIVIANWNDGHRADSLRFFAERGHDQIIAGYYDTGDLANFRAWNDAARGLCGVNGFMYTTWRDDYDQLAPYGMALRSPQSPPPR